MASLVNYLTRRRSAFMAMDAQIDRGAIRRSLPTRLLARDRLAALDLACAGRKAARHPVVLVYEFLSSLTFSI